MVESGKCSCVWADRSGFWLVIKALGLWCVCSRNMHPSAICTALLTSQALYSQGRLCTWIFRLKQTKGEEAESAERGHSPGRLKGGEQIRSQWLGKSLSQSWSVFSLPLPGSPLETWIPRNICYSDPQMCFDLAISCQSGIMRGARQKGVSLSGTISEVQFLIHWCLRKKFF